MVSQGSKLSGILVSTILGNVFGKLGNFGQLVKSRGIWENLANFGKNWENRILGSETKFAALPQVAKHRIQHSTEHGVTPNVAKHRTERKQQRCNTRSKHRRQRSTERNVAPSAEKGLAEQIMT